MDEYSSVLNEIVKAKENIKHKFNLLKSGEANTRSLIENTLKPIIVPLTKISEKKSDNLVDEKYNTIEQITKDSNIEDKKYNIIYNINHWFKSINIDKTYGPKQLSNGEIKLGQKEVDFDGYTLVIEDSSYVLTHGLEQLLFSKNPGLYTQQDLTTYKQILLKTSAHLTVDGKKIKKQAGVKYNIVLKLFPSGRGMKYGGLKLQRHNILYWNDPNELVDRLRLLLASQAAGNTSVKNEILSIFEELYEAGITKRIPNV